jgi:hypothetical protein
MAPRTPNHFLAAVTLLLTAACGDLVVGVDGPEYLEDGAFVRVARPLGSGGAGKKQQGLLADGGIEGITPTTESFYIAINRNELGKKWFFSAYLAQFQPASTTPVSSLGIRVVSFKIQNDKLYVFDASDTHAWSDALNPEVIIEAYPIVTDFAPFNRLGNYKNYVLVDPSAGLNRFSALSDAYASGTGTQFQIDLSFLQRFRKLGDGVSWEQVFTGYSDAPLPGINEDGQPYRASGTLGVALRRYVEGAGFVQTEMPKVPHYFPTGPRQVPNEDRKITNAVKWNIHPGMTPIRWYVSSQVQLIQGDPRFKPYDVFGAIKKGVEGWNDVFGFPVFEVVVAGPDDNWSDDDKNFIVVDRNPAAGLAFANWRENPNTGEIRGASVYLSNVFLDQAEKTFKDGAAADAGTPPMPGDGGTTFPTGMTPHLEAPKPGQVLSGLRWDAIANRPMCALWAKDLFAVVPPLPGQLDSTLTKKAKIEKFLTHVVMHEVGHTLGLRHNFKGSLNAGSVMDYLNDQDSVALDTPGTYDRQAIQYLYGWSTALPTDPFCTDEDRAVDPDCEIFDTGSDPLVDTFGPNWTRVVDDVLLGRDDGSHLTYGAMWGVAKYIRAGATPEKRAQAWHLMFDQTKVPLDTAKTALNASYAGWADVIQWLVVNNLYLDPAQLRGPIGALPPIGDVALQQLMVDQLKGNLIAAELNRSFESRRSSVDALKVIQTPLAYQALVDGRAALVAQKALLTPASASLTDDLIRRIDVQCSPYFQ